MKYNLQIPPGIRRMLAEAIICPPRYKLHNNIPLSAAKRRVAELRQVNQFTYVVQLREVTLIRWDFNRHAQIVWIYPFWTYLSMWFVLQGGLKAVIWVDLNQGMSRDRDVVWRHDICVVRESCQRFHLVLRLYLHFYHPIHKRKERNILLNNYLKSCWKRRFCYICLKLWWTNELNNYLKSCGKRQIVSYLIEILKEKRPLW